MRIEELNSDFNKAYHTMVETIEELVVDGGKSFNQALLSAEKKMSEWSDLTKEEIEETSNEIKHDFLKLGENLNKAKESYKEEFKLDAAYVTDSIWDKLLNIMDSNTAQLLAFKKNLEEQIHEIKTEEHLTIHQEHTQWNAEHELWLGEIALWNKEHAEALIKLDEISVAINQYSNALDEHAQVIQAHEARDHEHEKVIANAERDPSSQAFKEADENDTTMHQQERQVHSQHAELHNSLKRNHSEMMTLVNRLYKKALQK